MAAKVAAAAGAAMPRAARWALGRGRRWTFSAAAGGGAGTAHSKRALPEGMLLVKIPKLSPSMTHGSVARWLQENGSELQPYDLLFEVATESLTEDANKIGKFAGLVTLQVECCDHATLVRRLVPDDVSRPLPVGTPIALLVEDDSALPEAEAIADSAIGLEAYDTSDVLEMNWSAYLKESR